MEKIKILGIKIDNITFNHVLSSIENYLNSSKTRYIVTPNPEIILQAQKDKELMDILNTADLAIPDGIGLKIASKFKIKERITGTDLMFEIFKKYKSKKYKFIINENGLSSKKEIIEKANVQIDDNLPDIILVGLGCPQQEKWIKYNSIKYPSAKLILTIGGGFDFLTGKQKRAPLLLRKIGLEWLWRLYNQPKRYKRIFNATIIFIWKTIMS
jgi:N-acetylglucosaminyldiphosphoundecaprenol N-acetyl-beta-D-mannosaminyltransferase